MKIAWGVNVRAVKIPTFNKTLLYNLAIDQHDQHVQREEQEDDDHFSSDLEDNFAEDKVINNQLSLRLAETELYTTSQLAAQPPLQQIGDEKVVVTPVKISTVKQIQNIVAG